MEACEKDTMSIQCARASRCCPGPRKACARVQELHGFAPLVVVELVKVLGQAAAPPVVPAARVLGVKEAT